MRYIICFRSHFLIAVRHRLLGLEVQNFSSLGHRLEDGGFFVEISMCLTPGLGVIASVERASLLPISKEIFLFITVE